ncbi:hypothetical protein V2J09_019406 [Rumex salicifolius]
MANFTPNLYTHNKPPFSVLENDMNMQLVSPFPALHPMIQEDFNQNFQSITGYSIDNFVGCQMQEFPGKLWVENFPPQSSGLSDQISTEMDGSEFHESCKKRKVEDLGESCSRNSSPPPISEDRNLIKPRNASGKGKRVKNKKETEEEKKKPKEVVHVRARRGQATDSHSLAERVRRGKINEKFKCLQDMVPGCYKAMGMAVMLDEIINYVQSLQNQVEFLSMKLATASALHDYNSQSDCIDNLQAKPYEAQDVDRLLSSQGYDQAQLQAALACLQSSWPSI